MKRHGSIMGMTVRIEICDSNAKKRDIDEVLAYFDYIDRKFSTYKNDSEISQINNGKLQKENYSQDMKQILNLCNRTKIETKGYFDINIDSKCDPSGVVKGYAVWQAGKMLKKKGYKNYFVEIGGDIQACGKNLMNQKWRVGIQNPFNKKEIIKIVYLRNKGIATSGNYIRGTHIYNPIDKKYANDIASITVVGPNVYEADRFATAAFAMGEKGINFIESLKGLEGYMIKNNKKAVFTTGFERYLAN